MPATKLRPAAGPSIKKQVLFVQGGGRDTHDSWDNKLVASLKRALGGGYAVRYPRMPGEAEPDAVAWKKVLTRELGRLGDGAILVGHSLGAAILLDHLLDDSGNRQPARSSAGTFLIAPPFIGDGGWPSDDLQPTSDLAGKLPAGAPLYVYQGSNDQTVPFSHIGMFTKAFPDATIRRLGGRDHQLNDDLSEVAHDIKLLR
jgi:predicted alpha/beta hydrolase family esterase